MSSSMASMLIGCDRDDPFPGGSELETLTIGALSALEANDGRLVVEENSTTDLCSSILWMGGGDTDGGETRSKSWF